jgi:hypothetical protein
MEHGAIGADMMEASFRSASGPGGQFFKMMEKQSTTTVGIWSNFMDNVNMKLLSFGNALLPVAKKTLDFGNAMMRGEPWAVALAVGIGLLTLSLTWASVQTTIYSAVTRSAAFFTGLWSGAQTFLNAALWSNPITWVVAGIIALIAVIGYVVYKTDGWGKQWDSLIKFFKFSWSAFKDYFYLVWLNIQDTFMTGIELIEKGWYHLKSLWDKEGAAAGLSKINNQQNLRAAEIAKAKGVLDSDLKSASNSLTWDLKWNDKNPLAALKNKFGLGAATKTGVTPTNFASDKGGKDYYADLSLLNGDGEKKSNAINGGGQRSIVINISKVVEKLEQHIIGGGQVAAEEFASMVREQLARELRSLNGVATS